MTTPTTSNTNHETTSSTPPSPSPSPPTIHIPKHMTGILYNQGTPKRVHNLAVPQVTKQYPILVRIHAAGVNPVDAKYVLGDKLPDWSWVQAGAHWLTRTCIPGFDFSGVVCQVHPECPSLFMSRTTSSDYQVGDWVFGTVPPLVGTFCEYQRVPLDQICKIPPQPQQQQETEHELDSSLSSLGVLLSTRSAATLSPNAQRVFVTAAALPLVGLTALQCMAQNQVNQDSHLLVIGASGGTGHFAVQYAKHVLQVKRVVGLCRGDNVPWVTHELGADHAVDYRSVSWQQDIYTQVQTYGPFTHVLDTVTSAKALDKTMSYESFFRGRIPTPNGTTAENKDAETVPPSTSSSPSSSLPLLLPAKEGGRYLKLGGDTSSWLAAGVKRVCGLNLFWSRQSELFWIRFPHSSHELQQLAQACWKKKKNTTTTTDESMTNEAAAAAVAAVAAPRAAKPYIAEELDFYQPEKTTTSTHDRNKNNNNNGPDATTNTDDNDEMDNKDKGDPVIAKAFSLLLGRRTKGKIVLNLMNPPPLSSSTDNASATATAAETEK
ncbi:hypothetical protein ACA910_019479 [Epithemia clementina (nom. ined.)]